MIGVFFIVLPVAYAVLYSAMQTLRTGDCGPKVGIAATLKPSFDPAALEDVIQTYRDYAAREGSDEGCSDEWDAYRRDHGFTFTAAQAEGAGSEGESGGGWLDFLNPPTPGRAKKASENPGVEKGRDTPRQIGAATRPRTRTRPRRQARPRRRPRRRMRDRRAA